MMDFGGGAMSDTKDQLEDLVDFFTLRAVLRMLSEICSEKAEHLQVNWQDNTTAKNWESASKLLDEAATKAYELLV
jgi:hypothetical protein